MHSYYAFFTEGLEQAGEKVQNKNRTSFSSTNSHKSERSPARPYKGRTANNKEQRFDHSSGNFEDLKKLQFPMLV